VVSKIALAFGFAAIIDLACGQDQSATGISREVKDVFDRSAKAVVKVHGVDEHSEILGTGFFIDPTGMLYTSYTVGGEAGNFTIEFEGKSITGKSTENIVKLGIAHVPQGRGTFTTLTVEENLQLGAITRRDKAGVVSDIERMYDHFPVLKQRHTQQAGTLSGGEPTNSRSPLPLS